MKFNFAKIKAANNKTLSVLKVLALAVFNRQQYEHSTNSSLAETGTIRQVSVHEHKLFSIAKARHIAVSEEITDNQTGLSAMNSLLDTSAGRIICLQNLTKSYGAFKDGSGIQV